MRHMTHTLGFHLHNNNATLPGKHNPTDSGIDIFTDKEHVIRPGETCVVSTGVSAHIPQGLWLKVEGRSSLAAHGIFPIGGIIDQDYRGEIKIIIHNSSPYTKTFDQGAKIAQLVPYNNIPIIIEPLDIISLDTTRADKGFGSSGA